MEKKYKFTGEIKEVEGHTLHRIEAIRNFGLVEKSEKGGWIEKEGNLSHEGNCWVSGDAIVYDNARVVCNAVVTNNAKVYGEAWVGGNANVGGNAEICRSNDYCVIKNFWSSGRYFTYTRSNKMWKVGCFHGTGNELIKKAYEDSEEKGKCYKMAVKFVESIENTIH